MKQQLVIELTRDEAEKALSDFVRHKIKRDKDDARVEVTTDNCRRVVSATVFFPGAEEAK